eukprot:COSAG06_NODE_4464_length_4229_cov_2.660291_8_plen_168_part_01
MPSMIPVTVSSCSCAMDWRREPSDWRKPASSLSRPCCAHAWRGLAARAWIREVGGASRLRAAPDQETDGRQRSVAGLFCQQRARGGHTDSASRVGDVIRKTKYCAPVVNQPIWSIISSAAGPPARQQQRRPVSTVTPKSIRPGEYVAAPPNHAPNSQQVGAAGAKVS